jgi:hypothetical protein
MLGSHSRSRKPFVSPFVSLVEAKTKQSAHTYIHARTPEQSEKTATCHRERGHFFLSTTVRSNKPLQNSWPLGYYYTHIVLLPVYVSSCSGVLEHRETPGSDRDNYC